MKLDFRKIKRHIRFYFNHLKEKAKGLDFTMMQLNDTHFPRNKQSDYYGYFMTDEATIQGALKLIPGDLKERAFIDIGCGKGMCLKAACAVGFGKVAGLELEPSIAAIGKKNMEILKLPATVIEGNAITFEHYDEYDVFYFYNPFSRKIFEQVIAAIDESQIKRPRTIHVAYLSPVSRDLFDQDGYTQINQYHDNARGSELIIFEKKAPETA